MPSEEVSIVLPPAVDRFPYEPHPRGAELTKQAQDWTRKYFGYLATSVKDFEEWVSGDGSGFCNLGFPHVDDEVVLQFHKWSWLMLVMDDLMSSDGGKLGYNPKAGAEIARIIQDVLHDRVPEKDGPVQRGIAELWEEFRCRFGPSLRERFVYHMDEMFEGFTYQAQEEYSKGDRSDDEVLAMRFKNGAIAWTTNLVEIGLNIDLRKDFKENPTLARMRLISFKNLLLWHEIVSFRKEYFQGELGESMNMVAYWAGYTGPGCNLNRLQEAIDKTHKMLSEEENEYIELKNEILASELGKTRPDICRWMTEMEYLLSGGMRFGFSAPRYNGLGHVWDGKTMSGKLILTPERTIFPTST
ncbi:hypothetical protein TWF694_000318 [Orbilia ellipsospora]|uniref:Terpene synthase n=1 Tax=Orbilia ellipsospora TaxID=2528407 RepID=A0AAV9XNK6_9PEZI